MIKKKVVRPVSARTARRRNLKAASFDSDSFKNKRLAVRDKKRQAKDPTAIAMKIGQSDDPIRTAFELLVPPSGKAKTVAGELVRAMNKILYRDYNDGDVFYNGYGVETCGDAVAFICANVPQLESAFEEVALRGLEDSAYTRGIKEIADDLINFIIDDAQGLLVEPNSEDMYDYDGKQFLENREWIPEYELECSYPDNLYEHIADGDISPRDIEGELEDWDFARHCDCTIEADYSGVYISGLDIDTYNELEDSMYRWLEDYGDMLDEEY